MKRIILISVVLAAMLLSACATQNTDQAIVSFGIAENEAAIAPPMDNAAAHAEIDKIIEQVKSANGGASSTTTEVAEAMTYIAQQSYWLSINTNLKEDIPLAKQEEILAMAEKVHYATGMSLQDATKKLTDAYTGKVPVIQYAPH